MSLRSPTLPTLLLPLRKSFLPLSSFYLDHLHQVSSYSSFWFSSVFISFGKPFLNFPVQLSIPFCIQTPGSGFAPLPPLPHCITIACILNCFHIQTKSSWEWCVSSLSPSSPAYCLGKWWCSVDVWWMNQWINGSTNFAGKLGIPSFIKVTKD